MSHADLLAELNRDVWHPFRAAYGALDGPAYLAPHTADLIRPGGPGSAVQTLSEVTAEVTPWLAEITERGDGLDIDFRFLERLVSTGAASERGVYQITARPADGEERRMYGRFHTFCRKVDGRWRIAVDYDSNEGGTIDVDTFRSGSEIDDLTAFTTG